MIIYNVTINIDDSVHDQWLNWLKTKHIGDVLATGCFYKAKLSKVLVDEEMGGTTYSIQYATESNEKLQEYYIISMNILLYKMSFLLTLIES